MSLCIKCSTPNPDNSSRCSKCGATLPRIVAAVDQTSRLFAVESGRVYPSPTETFDSENVGQLRLAIEDYLAGGEPAEVNHWLRHIREAFEEFSTLGIAGLNRALDVERSLNSEGDFHHHVGYLVHKGLILCGNGLTNLEKAIEAEDEDALPAAFDEFRLGNDHICTALLMIEDRREMLQEAVARYCPEDLE